MQEAPAFNDHQGEREAMLTSFCQFQGIDCASGKKKTCCHYWNPQRPSEPWWRLWPKPLGHRPPGLRGWLLWFWWSGRPELHHYGPGHRHRHLQQVIRLRHRGDGGELVEFTVGRILTLTFCSISFWGHLRFNNPIKLGAKWKVLNPSFQKCA